MYITNERTHMIMNSKSNKVVVAVIKDLTSKQAAQIQKRIVIAKHASDGRGIISTFTRDNLTLPRL
jgi:hypothetical protein